MKKITIISLIAAALMLTSCTAPGDIYPKDIYCHGDTDIAATTDVVSCGGDTDDAVTIDAYAASVHVSHALMGQLTESDVGGGAVDALMEWYNGLSLEHVAFDEGKSPGDEEGGEAFWFESDDGSFPEFSYIISGPDRHYVTKDSEWYRVKAPSRPPVGDTK